MGFFAVEYDEKKNPAGDLIPPRRIDGEAPLLGVTRLISNQRRRLSFLMSMPFGYEDEASGDSIVVPALRANSTTDLASVPNYLGWLAPKTGRNMPAALLHDVLIVDAGKAQQNPPADHVNHWLKSEGDPEFRAALTVDDLYDREAADRMFRDAMGDAWVSWPRRWIMWVGVSLATLWYSLRGWKKVVGAIRAIPLAAIAVLSTYLLPNSVADLADLDWFWMYEMPGTGSGGFFEEAFDWIVVLALLTAASALLFGLGTTRKLNWQVGVLFVPATFVVGLGCLISVVQALVFGAFQKLFPVRESDARFLLDPEDQSVEPDGRAIVTAPAVLNEGEYVQWVLHGAEEPKELRRGPAVAVDAAQVPAEAELIAEIRDADGNKVAESRAAKLTVQRPV